MPPKSTLPIAPDTATNTPADQAAAAAAAQAAATVEPPPPGSDSVFQSYEPLDGTFDEFVAPDGSLRTRWQAFVEANKPLGRPTVAERWQRSQRTLHENGVTYNVYGDPKGIERPWQLDPIPLILDDADWQPLEAGLVQRATLLNLIVQDIYGSQTLLKRNLLPPELLFANPGYLLPCFSLPVPDGRYLYSYAADLVRGKSGTWSVMVDRAQAPSGTGYALENRGIISDIFAEAFQACKTERLARFFHTLRENLYRVAPRHKDNPRIVLLTPGPYNETYFEHFFLARYLGFSLVQSSDLTVRDNCVYMMNLDGLKPVDVILRRLDDSYCDPLELRSDSLLGVPGLTHAARSGNVVIANALGTGWAESPGLMPFLPMLCRELLGEPLKLGSVETWWLGQPTILQHVLSDMTGMVVKSALPPFAFEPVFVDHLNNRQKARLIERLKRDPMQFVAQRQEPLSAMPVFTGTPGAPVESRRISLRGFVTATDGGYVAMRGGMTRVTSSTDSLVVSMQRGGGSKDTWIISATPSNPLSLLPPPGVEPPIRRSGISLPSRIADNLYWLGRYMERTEGLIRVLRVMLSRLTADAGETLAPELLPLVAYLRDLGLIPMPELPDDPLDELDAIDDGEDDSVETLSLQPPTPAELRRQLIDVVYGDRIGTLRRTLNAAERLASLCRDSISIDAWRIVRRLDDMIPIQRGSTVPRIVDVLEVLNTLVISTSAFSGLTHESMTRGPGWMFMDIGHRIERSEYSAGLLRACLVSTYGRVDSSLIEVVLEIGESTMTYRSRYLSSLRLGPLIDLLLTDESNPRSIAFQVAALNTHLERLPRDRERTQLAADQRTALDLLTRLRLADAPALASTAENGHQGKLGGMLRTIQRSMHTLSDELSQRYFSHSQSTGHFGTQRWDTVSR